MLGLYTFSPKDLVVNLSGLTVKDFAKGSFIEVNMNSAPFSTVAGIRGKSTRRASRDKSGRVTFKIQQTSPLNDVFSHIVEKDSVTYTGLLKLSITDSSGSTGLLFKGCYITAHPNISFSGDDLTDREWIINFEYVSRYHVGGNRNPALDILSNLT